MCADKKGNLSGKRGYNVAKLVGDQIKKAGGVNDGPLS